MLRTFFRSAIHATDSTFMGCKAKSAATTRLRHAKLVALSRIRKSSTAFAAWRSTLTVCGPSGFKPKIWQSRACESQAIGFQSESSVLRNAQTIVLHLIPARTCTLPVT